jgi:hypothetical protein
MPFAGFHLEDMEKLLPSSTREALSQAANKVRRLPKHVSDSMRKAIQLTSMNMALWQSLCVVAQMICFIAEEELSFHLLFVDFDRREGGYYINGDGNETAVTYTILALEFLFSAATVASAYFAIQ